MKKLAIIFAVLCIAISAFAQMPGTPFLTAPGNGAVNLTNYPKLTWNADSSAGVPTEYNIYFDTVDGSTLFDTITTRTYEFTSPLDWGTTYYWTVSASNDEGTSEPSAVRNFTVKSDPTIYLPWLEDFGTVNGDWPALNWTMLGGLYPTPVGASSQWVRGNWLNGLAGDNAAKINIYGTSRNGWLITPPIVIPADGYELKFDLGLTNKSKIDPIVDLTSQLDDRFLVIISDSPDMSNPTILREWNNTGSAYIFNNIPNTGESVRILLDGVSGTKYFAFYGESTVTGDSNDLHVDNVTVRVAPAGAPDPVALNSPVDAATALSINGSKLSWSMAETGGYPETYTVFMSQTEANLYTDHSWAGITDPSFDPTQAAIDPLAYNYSEIWYWTVKAINADGEALQTIASSFTIMDDPRILSLPYSQNFDGVIAPALPIDWITYVSATNTTANVVTGTSYVVSQPNSAKFTNGNDASADVRLITPDILVPVSSIKLSFSARGGSGNTILVGTVDALDETGVFTELESVTVNSTHTVYTVIFSDYTGTDQNICFKHGVGGTNRTIYIDNVYMEELVTGDLALTAFSGNNYGITGDEFSYSVSVYNNGTIAQDSYSIELLSMPEHTVLSSIEVNNPLASDASATHTILWTPAAEGVYDIYAKIVAPGDANSLNDESEIMTVGLFAPGLYTPFIGNSASTSSAGSLPINVFWNNSVTETIYMAHEMQMDSGTIKAIKYYNNFNQDLTKPVKIWMMHTTENVNDAWLPFEDYTLVFDGLVRFPVGINTIVIPLQIPFQYTGGNLALRANQVYEDDRANVNNNFYYTADNSYPNRSRYYTADSVIINPENPALTNAGARNSFIPNTAFIVDPYTALPALDAPAVQIETSDSTTTISWEAVNGAFNYVIYSSDDPYDWSEAVEIATTAALQHNVTTTSAKKFYKVVARSYNH
ncbi:MAG: hypothetical protein LHW56_01430 [Candidatus Cloacimonetes bacterium]|nr:hypothetical protein [Candidatus Cloacimonadota bacterium]MDY0171548.1 CARDB domain-containing protein [Candidatus Cloacimonadaceae bacterium]